MKNLTLRNIAFACRGTYHGPEEMMDTEVESITTDSRKASEDCLFVPIVGARSDGHDFIGRCAPFQRRSCQGRRTPGSGWIPLCRQ